jgi:hypothetical protein
MTVKLPNSDCGKLRDPTVPTVGRFKLSQIANMDQTPLPFKNFDGRTYSKKGEKTVWLKEHRSGWNKRQCVTARSRGISHRRYLTEGPTMGISRGRYLQVTTCCITKILS